MATRRARSDGHVSPSRDLLKCENMRSSASRLVLPVPRAQSSSHGVIVRNGDGMEWFRLYLGILGCSKLDTSCKIARDIDRCQQEAYRCTTTPERQNKRKRQMTLCRSQPTERSVRLSQTLNC